MGLCVSKSFEMQNLLINTLKPGFRDKEKERTGQTNSYRDRETKTVVVAGLWNLLE